MNAEVKAFKFTDVRGKEQLYLSIEAEHGKMIINIGEKTFNEVEKITAGDKAKLIIEQQKTKAK